MKAFLTGAAFFLLVTAQAQQNMTLETVISTVLERNFNVRIERNNVQTTANDNNIGNAGYLPTLSVTADQNWSNNDTRQEFFSGDIKQADGARNRSTNALVLMNWTFFDGFRMFATDQRLQLREDQAGLQLTAEMEMNIYQAAVLYYTILQQQELTPVYEQALGLSRARYDVTELKLRNGAATELEIIQARLDLAADSSVLLQHNRQLADLKIDLNTLMGRPSSDPLVLSGAIVPDAELTWENAFERAKSQNTTLLLAKSNIAIAEAQRKEARSYYYPQLSFYTQYVYATQQNQIGLLQSSRTSGIGYGLTFRWTILDRLSNYTALKNNQLQIANAELVAEQQTQFLEAELRKTYNEYLWAQQNLALEQQNIVNTEEIFALTETSLRNGAITPLELREIQFSVVQAKSRLLMAQLALKTAELDISLTTGGFQRLLR